MVSTTWNSSESSIRRTDSAVDLLEVSIAELSDQQLDQMRLDDLIDVVRLAANLEPDSSLVQILRLCDFVTLRRLAKAARTECRDRIMWSEFRQRPATSGRSQWKLRQTI